MSTAAAPPAVVAPEDEVFSIGGLSWDQYVAIADTLGDQAGLRILFHQGRLTFVSPARVHEWSGRYIDTILLAIADGCDIEMDIVGGTTLRKQGLSVGLEGDEVYYLRDNVARMGGSRPIDLSIDPPPDLAIEVENTHKAGDSMPIYAQIGVPEVWRHDVRRGTLEFLALEPDGSYRPVSQSPAFPFLSPDDVLFQVRRAEEIRSRTRWFRQLNEWVRDVIAPRLNQP